MNDYAAFAALAHSCPPIRVSHPPAMDNTPRFAFDDQTASRQIAEPAKVVLCFDCQKEIEAGKGIQVVRSLRGPVAFPHEVFPIHHLAPIHTLVHPECEHCHAALHQM